MPFRLLSLYFILANSRRNAESFSSSPPLSSSSVLSPSSFPFSSLLPPSPPGSVHSQPRQQEVDHGAQGGDQRPHRGGGGVGHGPVLPGGALLLVSRRRRILRLFLVLRAGKSVLAASHLNRD